MTAPSSKATISHVATAAQTSIDLFWLPLGAGGCFVRLNGRIYEMVAARLERRPACDLYHSALEVRLPEGRFVIEQAPMRAGDGAERGVVAQGAVGSRWVGRARLFRYELRLWRDGVIPDVDEAVDGPGRLREDPHRARRLLELVPVVPTPVWGRDELRAGEMWNSNSMIAWLVARSGLGAEAIEPPLGGRAPGWKAGLAVAAREEPGADSSRHPGTGSVRRRGAPAPSSPRGARDWQPATEPSRRSTRRTSESTPEA